MQWSKKPKKAGMPSDAHPCTADQRAPNTRTASIKNHEASKLPIPHCLAAIARGLYSSLQTAQARLPAADRQMRRSCRKQKRNQCAPDTSSLCNLRPTPCGNKAVTLPSSTHCCSLRPDQCPKTCPWRTVKICMMTGLCGLAHQ